MKVTIVTISYNQAVFLEKTILSVLSQDYTNVEYIVVDPGSTDGSRELIAKYRKKIDQIIFEPDLVSDGLTGFMPLAIFSLFELG
jgi:glycosyltransferase involved in cell wall biosynthesis